LLISANHNYKYLTGGFETSTGFENMVGTSTATALLGTPVLTYVSLPLKFLMWIPLPIQVNLLIVVLIPVPIHIYEHAYASDFQMFLITHSNQNKVFEPIYEYIYIYFFIL
jgi:hypothetical protein